MSSETLDLADILERDGKKDMSFDRIDLSNAIDHKHLGIKAGLKSVSSLLRPNNTRSAIIGHFLHAIDGHSITAKDLPTEDQCIQLYKTYMPSVPRPTGKIDGLTKWHADLIQYGQTCFAFADFNKLLTRILEQSDGDIEKLGLVRRRTNKIVSAWPLKLAENASKEDFDYMVARGDHGETGFCEWHRL